jgi:hypothetical protein
MRQTRRVLQRPPAGTIPDAPGSYQFRDKDGRVIYVGKAKSSLSALMDTLDTQLANGLGSGTGTSDAANALAEAKKQYQRTKR